MCKRLLEAITPRPKDLKGTMCQTGLPGCHDSENKMYNTSHTNLRMGHVRTVQHQIIRTARHTWRYKALR